MKNIVFTLIVLAITIQVYHTQGSGNCLLYDGTSNYTQIPDNTLFSSHYGGEFTVEAWVKVLAVNTDGHGQTRQPIVAKGRSGQCEWALYVYDNLRAGFSSWRCSGASHSEISGGSIVLNQWHHIAASFDDNNFNKVYIDGVLVATGTSFSGSACNGSRPVIIGSREDGQHLNAYIDEVRMWDRALSQTEIRTNMCQKLIGSEANLIANFRIDEGADNLCGATEDVCDLSANNFKGTNHNTPLWNYSGAPIGDESTFLYTNSWSGTTINLNSANNGNVELSNITNNPDGVHLYRVDEVPNSSIGITKTLGSNQTYYGTFIANYPWGGTYDIVYDYTNYPDAIHDEADLILYARDNNSILSWADNSATLNTSLNTLRSSAESSRSEYVIALSSGALPIELISFDLKNLKNNAIQLFWSTSSEINNKQFEIQRSDNTINWETIGVVESEGNSSLLTQYDFIDYSPLNNTSYYRLKQIDFDGQFTYSKIESISLFGKNNIISLYPNPTSNNITFENDINIEVNEISIYNTLGQNITSRIEINQVSRKIVKLNVSNLENGLYFLKSGNNTVQFYKK